MPYDFSNFKVPVFTNINDKPVEPTPSKAGNGADIINRFNNLVDEFQSALNSLPTTVLIFDWSIKIPDNDSIKRIDVYYLNISETALYNNDSSHYLGSNDLLKSFVVDYDFYSGETARVLNISGLVIDNGCGYYIFVATDIDDQFLQYLEIEQNFVANPRGGARLADRSITFVVDDIQGINTNLNIKSLVIAQPASTVQVTLFENFPD